MIDLSKKFYYLVYDSSGTTIPNGSIRINLTENMSEPIRTELQSLSLNLGIMLSNNYSSSIDLKSETDIPLVESILNKYGYEKEPDNNKVRYFITNSQVKIVTRAENKDSETGFCNRLPSVTLSEIKSILSKYDGFKIIYHEVEGNSSYPCSIGFTCGIDNIDKVNEVYDQIKSIINYE